MISTSSFTNIGNQVKKFTIDNSPLILTGIGTAGVLGVAFLTAKAATKAERIIEAERYVRSVNRTAGDPPIELSFIEKAKLTWLLYLPPAGAVVLTCGAIIGANQIGTRRAAAMAAAFTVSEKAWEEYKDKVKETIGVNKENKVVDGVAQDRVNNNPPGSDVIVVNNGKQMFQDSWSGRYFMSDVEAVRAAVNQLNHQINSEGNASLSDFYEYLGLSKTRASDEFGWDSDKLLDVYFAAVMSDDNTTPVIAIEYRVVPGRDYFRHR